jgi:hypothetical protein
MQEERQREHCCVCGDAISGTRTICGVCEGAFGTTHLVGTMNEIAPLDLDKYGSRMFPWEPMRNQPALIISKRAWVAIAVGLVILVLLLALLRTPLPSCWEISS